MTHPCHQINAFTVQICYEHSEHQKCDTQQLNDSSMGVKSGKYGGRYAMMQPVTLNEQFDPYKGSLTCIVYQIDEEVIMMNSAVVKYKNGLFMWPRIHLGKLEQCSYA
jgi:hypothetical protein